MMLSEWIRGRSQFPSAIQPVITSHSQALFSLGTALYEQGNYREAAEQFSAYLALNPTDADGFYNLALVHLALEDVQEARTALTRALSLNSSHASALNNLAEIQRQLDEVRPMPVAFCFF